MKKYLAFLNLITLVFSLPLNGFSQTSQKDQKITVSTAEVQLDVVVKDKKGHPVKDLKVGDFEVYEDGARQQIESFRLVTREAGVNTVPAAAGKNEAPAPGGNKSARVVRDAEAGISAVALVFDRLSPDARKRAMDAALSYVGTAAKLDSFMGVFTINLSLGMLQNYTTDAQLVRKGVERAGISASSTFDSSTALTSSLSQRQLTAATAEAAAISNAQAAGAAGDSAGAGAAGSAAGAASVDAKFAEMQQRTAETFDVLQRDQQGYATTNGLLALINSMKLLPGRKAVIFFSEGLALPPNVRQHFRSVITNANRANVSVYSVDAAGLRIDSPLQSSRTEVEARARQRIETLDRIHLGGPMTAGLERNEDILKLNPQSGLTDLAQETGGAFIGDTNNIAPKLKQVDEDLHTYYLLTYSPASQNYDGKFRNIALKVNRSGVDWQSRKGYFAVPATGGTPVLFYETPGLAALNSAALAHAFPIQSGAMNFPEAKRPGRVSISVQAPSSAFTFLEDKEKKTFSTDFSIVVLVKDQAKQVVSKLSQHYIVTGPLEKVAATKKGAILFYRETDLPPGNYLVETVAYDLPANKASLNRSSLEVGEGNDSKLRLSSVTIIQRVEQIPVGQKNGNPFEVGDVMIYPNLGDPVKKAAGRMGFYFTVYPVKDAEPKLTLEVMQHTRSLVQLPLKLPAPDASGRIQYASALPLESLQPGEYDLRITVRDAQSSVMRSGKFTIE